MNEQNRIFAKNLSEQLESHNKTQADLAKHCAVSTASVAYWATGQKMPRIDKVQMIADYLNIKKSDLLEEHDSEDEQLLVEFHKFEPEVRTRMLEYFRLLNKEKK